MRSILILIILSVLVSCRKEQNNVGSNVSMVIFEQKIFTTIRNGQNKSLIRSKLLNSIVEKTFPPAIVNPDNAVKKHDELDKYVMTETEKNLYEEKEKNFSKIIVSYHDREEIYFIPDRVPVSNIISELDLTAGVDRVFNILPTDNEKTYKGGVVYLVSLNHRDLMKNDQKFFNKLSDENIVNRTRTIDSNVSVVLFVDYSLLVQKLVPKTFGGHIIKCTPELREEGSCGVQCAYKKDVLSSEYESMPESRLDKLGFNLQYGEHTPKLEDLQIVNTRDGHFEVKVDYQEVLQDNFLLTINPKPSESYYKRTLGYDYTEMCSESEREVWSNEYRQSKVEFKITMQTFGRGAELLKIKL